MHKFCNILTVFEPFSLGLNFLFCETFTIPIYVNRVFRHVFGIFYYFCLLFLLIYILDKPEKCRIAGKICNILYYSKKTLLISVFSITISAEFSIYFLYIFYIFSTYSSISSCWLRCPHLLLRQCLHLKCRHLMQQMSQYLICLPLLHRPKGLLVRSHHMNLMYR